MIHGEIAKRKRYPAAVADAFLTPDLAAGASFGLGGIGGIFQPPYTPPIPYRGYRVYRERSLTREKIDQSVTAFPLKRDRIPVKA